MRLTKRWQTRQQAIAPHTRLATMATKCNQVIGAETVGNLDKIKQTLQREFAGRLGDLDAEIFDVVLTQSNYDLQLSRQSLADMLHINLDEPVQNAADVLQLPVAPFAQKGFRTLIMMRGLPGSGKSTCALSLLNSIIGACNHRHFIFSADDFFIRCGEYRYNPYEVRNAHDWCKNQAYSAMQSGISPVIIDNTNTQMWEMIPYVQWAVEAGYRVFIMEPGTPWMFKVGQLARRNSHNVSREKIAEMCDRYERDITVERLFELNNLSYGVVRPPLMRNFPPVMGQFHKVRQTLPTAESTDKKCAVKRDLAVSTKDEDFVKELTGSDTFVNDGMYPSVYPCHGCFDKSTLTEGVDEGKDLADAFDFGDLEAKEQALSMLNDMFDQIPREHLEYTWSQCRGDLQSCIDVLVEDNSTQFIDIDQFANSPTSTDNVQQQLFAKKNEEVVSSQVEMDVLGEDALKTLQRKKETPTEAKLAVKKQLEMSVAISPEHYSPHVLKLKGIATQEDRCQPRTRGESPRDIEEDGFVVCERVSDPDDSVSLDSEGRSSDAQDEDMVELNLGPDLVDQLNQLFGDPGIPIPGAFQPTVEVPRRFANQLHALYYESLLKQMEAQQETLQHMLAEDEELQLKLQLEEIRMLEEQQPPDLKQIMKDQAEEQRALRLAGSQWRNLAPQDMAYKMTMQKLAASFPAVSSDFLQQVYHANECRFAETVEELRDSGATYVANAMRTISACTLEEMQAAHDTAQAAECDDAEGLESGRQLSSAELRQEAQNHQKQRVELLNKATQYYNKGMTEVATFYSQLASQQTRMCERYNSLAAVQIVSEGFHRSNKSDIIDLHYLHVPEALTTLDIYIDEAISRLQSSGKGTHTDVMVITGRGKNSVNGIPRIRPCVEQRLKKRNLKFTRVNDGLIKVKIFKNSVVSAKLPC